MISVHLLPLLLPILMSEFVNQVKCLQKIFRLLPSDCSLGGSHIVVDEIHKRVLGCIQVFLRGFSTLW